MGLRPIGLGAAGLLVAVAIGGSELAGAQGQTPTVIAYDNYFQAPDGSRTPASVAIVSGGAVSFGYPAGRSQHDVHFAGGPASPSCSGSNAASQAAFDSSGQSATPQGPGWSGSCAFSGPGDYNFLCTLHPSTMYGTVHVSAPPGNPATAAPVVSAVAVSSVQHGGAVTGTVTLGSDGSRLVVGVYAQHSLLAVAHSVLIGQTVATALPAGRHSFRVALNGAARRALRRHRRLAVKLKLSVSAGSQPAVVVTRHLTLTA